MKIAADAGTLSTAFASAASILSGIDAAKFPALGCVRLKATAGQLEVAGNNLDAMLSVRVPAMIEAPGEVLASGARLTGIVENLPGGTEVQLAVEGDVMHVAAARSRYRVATVPLDCGPLALKLTNELGSVELTREQAHDLFARTAFAIPTRERARGYLCGVSIRSEGDDTLTAAASCGKRLVSLTIGDLKVSGRIDVIAPAPSVKVGTKLLSGRAVERVVLRCSASLLSIECDALAFVTRLVAGNFPDVRLFVPKASGCCVTVDRAGLAQALARAAAASAAGRPIIGLQWGTAEPALHLSLVGEADAVIDDVEATTGGEGRVALLAASLTELVGELTGKQACIDAAVGGPVRIADPSEPGFLMLDMPTAWPA